MPVQDGDYIQLTEDEIVASLESELQARFGEDIDLTESSVFSTFAGALANTLAENQEQSLSDVFDAGYLDTATDENLDRVVALVGINRRSPSFATGVQRWESDSISQGDVYSVNSGTTVQTGGTDPVKFETTEQSLVYWIDGFEDNSLSEWSGDTGSYSITQTQVKSGSYSLQADATNNTVIYNDSTVGSSVDIDVSKGDTVEFSVYPKTDTVPQQYVLLEDADNAVRTVLDDTSGEHRIEVLSSSSVVNDVVSNVTVPTGEYVVNTVRVTAQNEIVSTVYDSNGNEVDQLTLDEGNSLSYETGKVGVGSGDSNDNKYWDDIRKTGTGTNIRALNGGTRGNVPSNTLTKAPSPPSGFDRWYNPYQVGESELFDLDGDSLVTGTDEETDEELRRRTRQTYTGGGKATEDAILSALINEIDDVKSAKIYQNKTDSPKTIDGGTLPPYSFEAVVYGGNKFEIAEQIFDTKAVTANDVSGIHGTDAGSLTGSEGITVQSSINNQERDVFFTRPNKQTVNITLDIVTNENYVGDSEIKDIIVDYVGGENANGENVLGTGVAEDVLIDEIEDRVVGSENGVVGVQVDNDGDTKITTTPSKSVNSNGLQVVEIGQNTVAETTPSEITVNTTQQ